jgi:hypothetical protein
MNVIYDINSETGEMRLKFKKDLLDPLGDKKEIFEKHILPMLAMNDKFLLTGSLSLKLLGFEPIKDIGDFDFALLSKFTEEDYHNIKNFFNLHDNINDSNYGDFSNEPFKFDENSHLWQFSKSWSEETTNPDLMKNWFFSLSISLNLVLLGVLVFLNERYGLLAKAERVVLQEARVPGIAALYELNRNYQVRREMFRRPICVRD